jgi:hypothetical protein
MKYQITKNTMTSQGAKASGEVVELSDDEARSLMGYGRCVPFNEPETFDRSIGLDVSEEKVTRRGRPRKLISEAQEADDAS